jgi:hypothetical protein
MTIQFNCPNCQALIAFDSKHSGKRARCLSCGQIFVIPSQDYQTPEKILPVIEKGEPEPGFYRAVFIDTWKIFLDPENATAFTFVAAVVCFKFFLARTCCGALSFIVVWGWLLGFYLNIIYETAFGIDKLPEVYLGTSITFFWYIIKPFLIFFLTMAVVQLPFIITLWLFRNKGFTLDNIWQSGIGLHSLLQILFVLGLFFFPMAVLTAAVGEDITLFRPDYLLSPALKAFGPYLVVVALLVAACTLETQTTQYIGPNLTATAAGLTQNLIVQIIAIIAMRSIGLFYRHYSCYLPW